MDPDVANVGKHFLALAAVGTDQVLRGGCEADPATTLTRLRTNVVSEYFFNSLLLHNQVIYISRNYSSIFTDIVTAFGEVVFVMVFGAK